MSREYSMGRLYVADERDELYPIMPMLASRRSTATKRFWWSEGWWGDQGHTPHCVAFSWAHWLNDGPQLTSIFKKNRPSVDTSVLYCEAQKRDPWPGDCETPLYDGTSVRAGAKVLQEWGHIKEYRWAANADEIVQTILTLGPVIVGTWWKQDMFYPDSEGRIYATGSNTGGHAYVINGVDLDTGLFRIKNSWGRHWGKKGHAFISISDMDALIKDWGEACVPIQQRKSLV